MQEIPATQVEKTAAQKTAVFCAVYLPWILVAIFFLFEISIHQIWLFFYAIASGILARGLNEVVHIFYKKERPSSGGLIIASKNYSFPSGHASFLLGISFFIFLFQPTAGIIFILLSFLAGFARVSCGAHWWQDILGSAVVGIVSASLVYFFVSQIPIF